MQRSKVLETRRTDGQVYRRRKCFCGGTYVTEERRVRGMPYAIVDKSLERLRASEGRPA